MVKFIPLSQTQAEKAKDEINDGGTQVCANFCNSFPLSPFLSLSLSPSLPRSPFLLFFLMRSS